MSYAPSTPTVYTPGEDLSVNTGVSLLRWLITGVYVSLKVSAFILGTCNHMKLKVFLQSFVS